MTPDKIFLFIFLLFFTLACSSTKESTKQSSSSNEEVYVFDDVSDVPDVDTTSHEAVEVTVEKKIETTPTPVSAQPVTVASAPTIVQNGYIVQVGAFSTRDKAENFISSVKRSINYTLNTRYIEKTGFYAVQLPPFKTRKEAEKVRNELWNSAQFSDAFIVPPSK